MRTDTYERQILRHERTWPTLYNLNIRQVLFSLEDVYDAGPKIASSYDAQLVK